MTLRELLGEPDRLAFLLLLALVLLTLGSGLWSARRRAATEPATEPVTTWPYLVRLELVAGLATLLVTSWWAIALPLPLGPPAEPAFTPAAAKAPWFFVGVQELLQYFDPWLGGVVLPGLGLFGLAALPYLDRGSKNGRHRLRLAPALALAGLLGLWLLPAGVGLFLRGDNWRLQPIWAPAPVEDGPLPTVITSLADRLHLSPVAAQLLGGGLCLAPLLILLLAWPLARRRHAALGPGRYLIAGSLLILLVGVAVKVMLVAGLGVRYLWVTPWFRI